MRLTIVPFKKLIQFIVIAVTAFLQSAATQAQRCTPVNLQCEYIVNPLGIDATQPRLGWQLADDRMGAMQLAYQLFVGTDSIEVSHAKGNTRQTVKLNDAQQLASFNGKAFASLYQIFLDGKSLG